jgi:polyphosphate kinase
MKRMAVLRYGETPQGQALIRHIRDKPIPRLRHQAECYSATIVPELARHGIFLRNWDELTAAQQEEAGPTFESSLSPALTPLVIDPVRFRSFLTCEVNLTTA